MRTRWFSGATQVLTFDPAELVATKLRALYQPKKGRDLFDLWLALTEMGLSPADILECFGPYRPGEYSAATAVANLLEKQADTAFRADLEPLVSDWPAGYDIDTAAELVSARLLAHV